MSQSQPTTSTCSAAPTTPAEAPDAAPLLRGGLELGSAESREQRCLELLGEGAVIVHVAAPPPAARGRLSGHVSDAVEARLAVLGAAGPHPHATDLLGDQLYRARSIGAAGLVLSLDSLSAIRAPALTPEDSLALTTLALATRERPLVFLMDDSDHDAPAYARPVPLLSLLRPCLAATLPAPPETPDARAPVPGTRVVAPGGHPVAAPDRLPSPGLARARGGLDSDVPSEAPPTVVLTPLARAVERAESPKAERAVERAESPKAEPPRLPEEVSLHARALSTARGPQPLAVLKRLFVEHYLPLGALLDQGHREARAEAAFTAFRRNFERAYADACPTFALTGKRPRMVLDAFEEATRLARAVGARSTSLLMVPSLRADLGQRMDRALAGTLPPESRVEAGLLFAALPSTSARQEDTLARGVAALAQLRPEESPADPEWHTRGALRRVRIGSRDLYTLDTVAAWRSMPRGPEDAEDLVAALALAVGRHAHALVGKKGPLTNGRAPERTLLYVFGDHGFTYEDGGHTCDGGATPEEAIAPYFAYVLEPAN